ncbi:hypothetical protein Ancab_025807 [Ancistrocladus abbreviatus]
MDQIGKGLCREWVKGKVIGSGSFGEVHLAMSRASGRLFVVKSAQSGAGLKSLANEARIFMNLPESPRIVRCLGKEEIGGNKETCKLNIFMEYMAGGSLSDVIEKFGGSLDESVIRSYTKEILHGLNHLHRNGIIHCDLKCENVLLGSSGDVKLADLGCAKRKDGGSSKHNSKDVGGTPLWMAPEVLRGEGLDYVADTWSLGCTVIEMATGKPPYWGDDIDMSSPMAAVLKIACDEKKPQFPQQFSEEGLDFLGRCLERDPRRRWTADKLLSHPFVLGNCKTRMGSPKEDLFSPASVLDVGEDDEDHDDDGVNEKVFKSRNPFSMRPLLERGKMMGRVHSETDLASSSGSWVTVRS